jgi:hypothetical protein
MIGAAGFMAGPKQEAAGPRFSVEKEAGSRFAWVVDKTTNERLKRFDVLKGEGKNNGWNRADAMAEQLNKTA